MGVKNDTGGAPLHYTNMFPEIAKLLIKRGADVNAQDNHGYAPLHSICHPEVASRLLANSTDVNAKNKWGDAPLKNA